MRAIGLWAYVAFFLVGGMASTLTPLAVARLPHPGRVLVARETAGGTEMPPAFRRFTNVSGIASFGQGLIPSQSLYALSVLGMSAGFAVALSGVAAAGALAGSLAAGSFLLGGSSSRVLRASFLLRALAALCCVAAIPANPLAPAFLLVGSALFNGAGNAGALATNERLYRLAPANARVHCQSRFVGATGGGRGHRGRRLRDGAGPGTPGRLGRIHGPVRRVGDQPNDRDISDRSLGFVEQPVRPSHRGHGSAQRLRLATSPSSNPSQASTFDWVDDCPAVGSRRSPRVARRPLS